MLNAFQSVFMLMVITRACGMVTAGVFSIAYANANLFLNMGNFGMRAFEASDVEPRYGFRAYGRSRIVTSSAMVLCSWLWLAWSAGSLGYPWDKTCAIALMTLMKGMDAVEDVFDGNYQQEGRLDVAGRQMTLRIATTIVVFCVSIALTRDLVFSTALSFAWTAALLLVTLAFIRRRHRLPAMHAEARIQSPWALLKECLPLFLSAFLLFYIGNAPKYAIDAMMDDSSQAIYGFIAMPVFVVGLLAQFVYMPIVQPVSAMWDSGDSRGFAREFVRQLGIIAAITVACVLGAVVAGPPVLGILYHTDLSGYRAELSVLVFGGGLLAMAQLFTTGITIMRHQRWLVPGYVVVAVVALVSSGPAVATAAIQGASLSYVAYMLVLAAFFGAVFAIHVLRANRHGDNNSEV